MWWFYKVPFIFSRYSTIRSCKYNISEKIFLSVLVIFQKRHGIEATVKAKRIKQKQIAFIKNIIRNKKPKYININKKVKT